MRTIDQIHFHHSAGEQGADAILALHLAKGWGECAYHAIVEYDGTVRVMKGDERPAYSVGNFLNETTWAVCMVGDFTIRTPSPEQWLAATILVRGKVKQYGIPRDKVLGHREARANSACPGFSDAMCERFRFDVFNTPAISKRGEAEHMFIPTKKIGLLSNTVATPFFVHSKHDTIFITLTREANITAWGQGKNGNTVVMPTQAFKPPEARIEIAINDPLGMGNIMLHITDPNATVQQRDTR